VITGKSIRRAFLVSVAALGVGLAQPGWEKTEQKDALRGTSYLEFRLLGKFLTPPRDERSDAPALIARCQPGKHLRIFNGKVLAFYVHVGTVLNSETVARYRLDDGKVQRDVWSPGTDHTAAFFNSFMLNNFLYGHMFAHKEGSGAPIRKVVIAIDEYLAGEIVMQFDMPDPSEIQEACGMVAHKR
jgi:hypothetical protein